MPLLHESQIDTAWGDTYKNHFRGLATAMPTSQDKTEWINGLDKVLAETIMGVAWVGVIHLQYR